MALIKSKAEYLASEMYNAVSGLGTQEGTLIEILVSGNNQLIRDTAVAYKNSKCKNFTVIHSMISVLTFKHNLVVD